MDDLEDFNEISNTYRVISIIDEIKEMDKRKQTLLNELEELQKERYEWAVRMSKKLNELAKKEDAKENA